MTQQAVNDLIKACFESIETASSLLDSKPDSIVAKTGLGETALHYLVVENQLDAVRYLVSRGATLETVSDVCGTPLSEAASLGYIEMVQFLLSKGARIDLPGQHKPTILEAVRSGDPRVVEVLMQHGASISQLDSLKNTALHIATDDDERNMVLIQLIELGLDINAKALFDWSPLHVAAFHGAEKNVKTLLANGANAAQADSKGSRALDLASTSSIEEALIHASET